MGLGEFSLFLRRQWVVELVRIRSHGPNDPPQKHGSSSPSWLFKIRVEESQDRGADFGGKCKRGFCSVSRDLRKVARVADLDSVGIQGDDLAERSGQPRIDSRNQPQKLAEIVGLRKGQLVSNQKGLQILLPVRL